MTTLLVIIGICCSVPILACWLLFVWWAGMEFREWIERRREPETESEPMMFI